MWDEGPGGYGTLSMHYWIRLWKAMRRPNAPMKDSVSSNSFMLLEVAETDQV